MRRLKVSVEKRQAALKEIAKGKSPYVVAEELDVTPQAVYRWINLAKAEKAAAPSDLTRRVERLEEEVDFLRKLVKKALDMK